MLKPYSFCWGTNSFFESTCIARNISLRLCQQILLSGQHYFVFAKPNNRFCFCFILYTCRYQAVQTTILLFFFIVVFMYIVYDQINRICVCTTSLKAENSTICLESLCVINQSSYWYSEIVCMFLAFQRRRRHANCFCVFLFLSACLYSPTFRHLSQSLKGIISSHARPIWWNVTHHPCVITIAVIVHHTHHDT